MSMNEMFKEWTQTPEKIIKDFTFNNGSRVEVRKGGFISQYNYKVKIEFGDNKVFEYGSTLKEAFQKCKLAYLKEINPKLAQVLERFEDKDAITKETLMNMFEKANVGKKSAHSAILVPLSVKEQLEEYVNRNVLQKQNTPLVNGQLQTFMGLPIIYHETPQELPSPTIEEINTALANGMLTINDIRKNMGLDNV